MRTLHECIGWPWHVGPNERPSEWIDLEGTPMHDHHLGHSSGPLMFSCGQDVVYYLKTELLEKVRASLCGRPSYWKGEVDTLLQPHALII